MCLRKIALFLLLSAISCVTCIQPNGTTSAESRIVGGRAVAIVKHPHQISLRQRGCASCSFAHNCGGSIYNADTIITAAHCVNGREPQDLLVVAGSANRAGADGVVAIISKIIMHEDYNPRLEHDIALLLLATPLPLDGIAIAPIALVAAQPAPSVKAIVSGWGRSKEVGGFNTDTLHEADVQIVGSAACDVAYSVAYGPGRITESMLCAGVDGGGRDACQGDSGGPLVVAQQLAGVVSWGVGCARADYPGVYANVAQLREWILKNVETNSKFV